MTWTPPSDPIERPTFVIEPKQVLIWYDCLDLLFTFASEAGLHLALWIDELSTAFRYLVVPISQERVVELENGTLALLDACQSDEAMILDLECDGRVWKIIQAWRMKTGDIPADHLPVAGVRLRTEHETKHA